MSKSLSLDVESPLSQSEIVRLQISILITLCREYTHGLRSCFSCYLHITRQHNMLFQCDKVKFHLDNTVHYRPAARAKRKRWYDEYIQVEKKYVQQKQHFNSSSVLVKLCTFQTCNEKWLSLPTVTPGKTRKSIYFGISNTDLKLFHNVTIWDLQILQLYQQLLYQKYFK